MSKRYSKALKAEELARLDDSEIDFGDVAELDETFWVNAKLTPPRSKPNVNLRLSDDVVAFFKGDNPKGYTSRMAAVLTAYVQAHQSK